VAGDSAGAYIVLSAVAELDRADLARIAGQVLIYPLLQLDDEQWASSVLADTRVLGRLAVRYIRERLQPGETGIPSLLEVATMRGLPTLVVTGGALDPCRPDALAYVAALSAQGAKVELLQFPRLMHGFGNYTHALKPARTAVAEIGRAMKALVDHAPGG
jgi:acetyl esterase/lipase